MKYQFTFIFIISIIIGNEVPFQVGERLIYTAKFNIVPSGTASLEVVGNDEINGNETFHVRFKASTNPSLDRLYKLRDQVDIWMDADDLYTHKLKKNIREGNYHKKILTIMDYQNSLAVINNDSVKIDGFVRDPYSLFYYLRSIPLEVGQLLEFTSFENKKTTSFQLSVSNIEDVKTDLGKFECLLVKPFRKGKPLFKNEGDMKIWFSNDERKLPVQIQIKLKFGSMLLKLNKIKN